MTGGALKAEEISHNGDYIVGYGTILGVQHAFLLAATPEPSTLLLATAGLAGLLAYAWLSEAEVAAAGAVTTLRRVLY